MRPLLCVVLISLSQPVEAWGPEGHSLIARIADSQLTPAVRARVLEILGPDKAMASVASFADQVRSAPPPAPGTSSTFPSTSLDSTWSAIAPTEIALFPPSHDCDRRFETPRLTPASEPKP